MTKYHNPFVVAKRILADYKIDPEGNKDIYLNVGREVKVFGTGIEPDSKLSNEKLEYHATRVLRLMGQPIDNLTRQDVYASLKEHFRDVKHLKATKDREKVDSGVYFKNNPKHYEEVGTYIQGLKGLHNNHKSRRTAESFVEDWDVKGKLSGEQVKVLRRMYEEHVTKTRKVTYGNNYGGELV